MFTPESSLLGQEWITLQNHFEQYEKSTLLIKLTAVSLYFLSIAFSVNAFLVAIAILILWIQEGIFKTFQSRLGERILNIEYLLKQNQPTNGAACQLHSEWLTGRKGLASILIEYAKSATKPTVVFPYAVLVVILLASLF